MTPYLLPEERAHARARLSHLAKLGLIEILAVGEDTPKAAQQEVPLLPLDQMPLVFTW